MNNWTAVNSSLNFDVYTPFWLPPLRRRLVFTAEKTTTTAAASSSSATTTTFKFQILASNNYFLNFLSTTTALHFKTKLYYSIIEKVDRAVTNARRNIIAARESVTTWKVSQDALLILNLDSWSSLGFPMQEVPSLHRLMLTEGKVLIYTIITLLILLQFYV